MVFRGGGMDIFWNHTMDDSKSTRNNGFSANCLQSASNLGKKIYYQGAKLFNEIPIGLQSLTSRTLFKKALYPLSPESDQNQFSPNDIHTLLRD